MFLPLSPDFLMQLGGQRKPRYWQQHAQGCMGSGCIRGCPDLNPVGTRILHGTNRHRPNWELQASWPELSSATGGHRAQSGDFPNRPSAPHPAWECPLGLLETTLLPEGLPAQPWAMQGCSLAGNTTPPPSPGLSFPTPYPAKSLTSVRLSAAPDQGQCLPAAGRIPGTFSSAGFLG